MVVLTSAMTHQKMINVQVYSGGEHLLKQQYQVFFTPLFFMTATVTARAGARE